MRSDPPEVFELGAIDAALATAGFGLREASIAPQARAREAGQRRWREVLDALKGHL